MFFDESVKQLKDPTMLIYYLMLRRFEFDYEFINKGRNILETSVFDNINKNNLDSRNRLLKSQSENVDELRRGSYVHNTLHCNKDWPLCIYDLAYKNKIVLFFIIRIGENVNMIDDYFFKFTKNNHGMVELGNYNFNKDEEVIENKADEQFIPFKKLILERRVHKCPEEKPFELKSNELLHEKSKSCKNTMFEKLEHNLINSNTQKHEGGIIEKNEEIEDILAEIDNKSIIVI